MRAILPLLLLLPVLLAAAEPFRPEPTGAFAYAGIRFGLLLQGPEVLALSTAVQPDAGWPHDDGTAWETRGSIALAKAGATVALSERVVRRPDGGIDVDLRLRSPVPLAIQTAALVAELPADAFAGRSLSYNGGEEALPASGPGGMLAEHWKSGIAAIAIPLAGQRLVLRGDLAAAVADERAWGLPRFGLRLLCVRPAPDRLGEASLHLGMGLER